MTPRGLKSRLARLSAGVRCPACNRTRAEWEGAPNPLDPELLTAGELAELDALAEATRCECPRCGLPRPDVSRVSTAEVDRIIALAKKATRHRTRGVFR